MSIPAKCEQLSVRRELDFLDGHDVLCAAGTAG
jgi:hypothetical protein